MSFAKKHKKGLIALAIVAVLGVLLGLYIRNVVKQTKEILEKMQEECVAVETRDLSNVVPAVGTITSVASEVVVAKVSGTKINTLSIKEGDTVKAGDLVCVLDTQTLEENLEDANRSLKNTQSSANVSIRSASRSLNEAQTDIAISKERNDKKIADAKKKVEDYENIKNQSGDQYDAAMAEAAKYEKAFKEISKKVEDLQKQLKTDVSGNDALDLNDQLADALKEYQEISAAYSAAKSAASTHLANYNSYVSTINELENSYDTLKQTAEDAQRSGDSRIASSKDSITSANISKDSSMMSVERNVENLKEQIDACNVYAPISGLVTSVTAKEGDTYAGGAILTIEDVSAYEVVTYIDEYDISKIKVGQKVVIKTNATEDEILNGHVKSVAPRAETNSNSVVYKVVISIDTKNDKLRLDMNAKLSIILEEKNNVLCVPYDAIQYDESDNAYVEVKAENGLYNKVEVITGIASDYYTEIVSGDLKIGDEVKVPKDLSEIFDMSSMMIEVDDGGGF